MKQLCLDCFMKGRVKMLMNGQCPACGCRQSVIYAPAKKYGEPDYINFPQHEGKELLQ